MQDDWQIVWDYTVYQVWSLRILKVYVLSLQNDVITGLQS